VETAHTPSSGKSRKEGKKNRRKTSRPLKSPEPATGCKEKARRKSYTAEEKIKTF
jgi:hypothetical protein